VIGCQGGNITSRVWIKKTKENATPFEFCFKGTLVNLKGTLDYLLDEYNSKYSVGIGDNEDLSISEFRKRVKGKNSHAESFIEAYDAPSDPTTIQITMPAQRNLDDDSI